MNLKYCVKESFEIYFINIFLVYVIGKKKMGKNWVLYNDMIRSLDWINILIIVFFLFLIL